MWALGQCTLLASFLSIPKTLNVSDILKSGESRFAQRMALYNNNPTALKLRERVRVLLKSTSHPNLECNPRHAEQANLRQFSGLLLCSRRIDNPIWELLLREKCLHLRQ